MTDKHFSSACWQSYALCTLHFATYFRCLKILKQCSVLCNLSFLYATSLSCIFLIRSQSSHVRNLRDRIHLSGTVRSNIWYSFRLSKMHAACTSVQCVISGKSAPAIKLWKVIFSKLIIHTFAFYVKIKIIRNLTVQLYKKLWTVYRRVIILTYCESCRYCLLQDSICNIYISNVIKSYSKDVNNLGIYNFKYFFYIAQLSGH